MKPRAVVLAFSLAGSAWTVAAWSAEPAAKAPGKKAAAAAKAPKVSTAAVVEVPITFAPVSTAALTTQAVLARFEEFDRRLDTLRAHFVQSLNVEQTGMSSAVEGDVSYRKPEQLRIEHLRPERQTVAVDGKDIWIFRHATHQAIQSSLEDWKKADPTLNNLMQFGSYAKMLRSYEVSVDTGGARPELVLVPKEKGAAPLELRLGLDPEPLFPDETRLQVGGLRVKTVLSGIVFNPRLEAATFRFTPPEGSDVFRNFKPPQIQP